MYVGMPLEEFKQEWLSHFAVNIPERDMEEKVVQAGNYIWHIFSWELVDPSAYLAGETARRAFDRADKADAWCIVPFAREATVKTVHSENVTARKLEEETEIYVVAKDFSWTYIKTHEDELCGPYFYCKKS